MAGEFKFCVPAEFSSHTVRYGRGKILRGARVIKKVFLDSPVCFREFWEYVFFDGDKRIILSVLYPPYGIMEKLDNSLIINLEDIFADVLKIGATLNFGDFCCAYEGCCLLQNGYILWETI